MNQQAIQQAAAHIRRGHVIAYPTEAVWGLGCDPFNEAAVTRVLTLKQRPMEKGLLVVAADMEQLQPLLADLPAAELARLEASWPGPVTWLIPDPEDLYPTWVKGSHSAVAIRVSAHPLVNALCREFAGPVVSTSANLAGQPEIRSRTKLQATFAGKLDYILDGELGGADRPSEIRDLRSGRTIR